MAFSFDQYNKLLVTYPCYLGFPFISKTVKSSSSSSPWSKGAISRSDAGVVMMPYFFDLLRRRRNLKRERKNNRDKNKLMIRLQCSQNKTFGTKQNLFNLNTFLKALINETCRFIQWSYSVVFVNNVIKETSMGVCLYIQLCVSYE